MAQVEVERDGAVMIVTLNRPHRKNAMTLTMFALLADAWEEVTADDGIRCVILTGAEGDFSSGMDLRNRIRYDLVHGNFWMSGWVGLRDSPFVWHSGSSALSRLGHHEAAHQGAADSSPPDRIRSSGASRGRSTE